MVVKAKVGIGQTNNFTLAGAATEYIAPGSSPYNGATTSATGDAAKYKVYSNLDVGKMQLKVATNSTSSSTVYCVVKNGSDSSHTITVPSGTSGNFTSTDSAISMSSGDYWSFKNTYNATGTVAIKFAVFEITTASATSRRIEAKGSSTFTQTAVRYFSCSGITINSATESTTSTRISGSFTLKNLLVYVSVNTRTGNATVKSRIGSTDGNQTCTILATTTGIFEDTTNTDSVTSSSDVNISIINTTAVGGNTTTIARVGFELVGGTNFMYSANAGSGSNFTNTSASRYNGLIGSSNGTTTATESQVQLLLTSNCTFSQFSVRATSNASTTNTSVYFRKNSADGNLNVSITALTTGLFSDTTNNDACSSNDLVNLRAAPTTTGNIDVSFVALLCKIPNYRPKLLISAA